MRQTGRTSRIINFTIDQLFSVGEVIVTDHVAFEYPSTLKMLHYFIDRVERSFASVYVAGDLKITHVIYKIEDTHVVRFKLEKKENNE